MVKRKFHHESAATVKKAKFIQDGDEDSDTEQQVVKKQPQPQSVKHQVKEQAKEQLVKEQVKEQVKEPAKGQSSKAVKPGKGSSKSAALAKTNAAPAKVDTEDDDLEKVKKLEKEVHRSKEKLNNVALLLEFCQVRSPLAVVPLAPSCVLTDTLFCRVLMSVWYSPGSILSAASSLPIWSREDSRRLTRSSKTKKARCWCGSLTSFRVTSRC